MAVYDRAHKALREQHRPDVEAGLMHCAELVCLLEEDGWSRWIAPDDPWDLAHDRDHGGYLGPAHRRCNRAEGARFALGRDHPNDQHATPARWVL